MVKVGYWNRLCVDDPTVVIKVINRVYIYVYDNTRTYDSVASSKKSNVNLDA
jgi:hypothetical protein